MTDQVNTSVEQPLWKEESGPIDFPSGLPGFEEHKQFRLESRADMRPFLWLRSIKDEEVALPMIDCQLLRDRARPELSNSAAQMLGASSADDIASFFVLKVNPSDGSITANTNAPVLVTGSTSKGYQIFLDQEDLRVDEPLINLVPSTEKKT